MSSSAGELARSPGLSQLLQGSGVARLDARLAARYRTWLTALVAAAALVRILAVVALGDTNPLTASIWENGGLAVLSLKYGAITACICGPQDVARFVAHGFDSNLFTFPSAYVPPLPIFLYMAAFKILGVSKTALGVLLLLNVFGGSVAVYYCARIAGTLFGSPAISLTAGFIAAFHPVFVYSAATYHGVNIYLPLILAIFDLCSSRHVPSLRLSVGLGVLFGVTILIRTEYLFLGPAILAGALLAHRRWRLTAVTLLMAACIVLPWTLRNYIVFDRFMPVASTTGYALYKGFNPLANGSGHWFDAHGVYKLLGDKLAAVPRTQHYEVETDDVYRKAVGEFIREHPARAFLILPLRKLALFWLFDFYDPTTHQLLYQAAFWPIFFASLLGLWAAYRTGLFSLSDHRTVLLYFLAQSVVVVAYAVHARYRMNVEPFLFGYSALGVVALGTWLRRRPVSAAAS